MVSEQYRLRPEWAERYGERGQWYCVRDVRYHIEALAVSVEWDDPDRFVNYVRWALGVMAAHNIPAADVLATLRAMREAITATLPPPAAELACRHLDAALAFYPE